MQSTDNYTVLIEKINTFIRKYYLNNLLRGLIFLGAGLFSAYAVITLSEYFGNFNSFFRGVLFYGFILLNLGLIGWLVIPPLMHWLKLGTTLTHDEAADIIGKHFSDVNDKLLNTLQLKKLAGRDERHRELIEASIDQKIENLKPVRFPSAINIKDNSKYLKWILTPAAIIIIIGLAAPSVLTESTKKIIRHNEYFAPVAPFQFVVLNSTLSAVQGEDLKLDLKLQGNQLPADVYVETANNTFKLDKDNLTKFHYLFTNLQQNTSFRLTGNGFTSKPYEIKVNLRPSLLHFDIELKYPAYLHKKNEALANAGDLTIPAGTTVKWLFHTQNATGLSFRMNGQLHHLAPAGNDLFEHSEQVNKPSVYKLQPQNAVVMQSDSALYRINTIADEPPTINVAEKPDSVSRQAFYFNGRIQDDHGFSSLTFHYRIGAPGNKSNGHDIVKSVKTDLGQSLSDFFYFWNLKELGIKPGDEVTYFFEVADNDAVNGPKKARTTERNLHMPDANELREELNAGTTGVKQKMQSAIKLADQIERDSKKLDQTLLNKNSLSFDEKKQVEDLLQKRQELDELVKQIQADNQKNLYNRRENEQQSKELLEEQKQIENLLNNVLDPKTRELLQKLQQLMQQDQKDGTRNELSKMQLDNKSLKKELDRMLELYKKLEFDQKLNQNINQLKKLAEKQQQLAEDSRKAGDDKQADKPNTDRLQQQQQNLNKEFNDIKKALKDLDNAENKQDFKDPQQEEKDIENQMKESADQLAKNNKPKASQSQQQAARKMQQMAQKMEQEQQEEDEKQTEVDARQLRELLKSLVNSSFNQEKVMESLKTISMADPNYVTLAQSQKNIKDNLKTAEDSLFSLSKRIPQIQSTVNREIAAINTQIDNALESLGDRRTAEANRSQQYAMTSMNNLALMLSDALSQLQNKMSSKSGKGKSKQMSVSQLRQMQEKLSQNMQKMRDQMQKQGAQMGQSQHGQMSEQLAKMAREQQMIRQSLQQINKEQSKENGVGVKDADKISQEMEQTEKDIVNRNITDDAINRQKEIHTRLLEAEKAEQEREQDKQRESNAGKDMPPGYIKALQDYQQIKGKQTEQIKTVSPALNLYYKQKIKSYFDQLNAK
ncbi:DUF4175 family protein [Mucilaginibacter sp. UR6-11]|uniref:DUF4175 family protein n=1 Tax=Mucilaginibacter sp. UR6-11 TaxID=1435644 RepID=UPI001E3713A8|nr:DUF4175 family protein [Mucilaginibacter sp. UR6-11]MCC8424540.1 hypothetical protein [Mucilaginibacter sp. UR6-11]